MRKILRRLIKFAAYSAAGVVILLAISVALFRLFLPRLPEYQDDIKTWASTAIGMRVEFTDMDARWGLRGPELKFYGAELIRPVDDTRLIAADEVGIGVSLMRLLIDRTLVVDTVTVSDTAVEVRQLADGHWQIQGAPAEDLLRLRGDGESGLGEITVIGESIEVQYLQPGDERPRFFEITRVVLELDDLRLAIDANITLPADLGGELQLSATRILPSGGGDSPWNVAIAVDSMDLAGISELYDDDRRRFTAGRGEVDLSMAIDRGKVVNVTADIELNRAALESAPAFDARGRIELRNKDASWLIAANDLVLRTDNGEWPRSSLRLETGVNEQGSVSVLDARASYLNLSDIGVFAPWLADAEREFIARWRPAGVLRDLVTTVSDSDNAPKRFSITAEIENAGFAANGKLPGVTGFTGSLRADHEGGLLEINAAKLALDLAAWMPEPVEIDSANGTVIWRHGDARTTILSDNIVVRNAFFDSQSNIEVAINSGAAPVVDLSSTWSISDVAAAKRFIPEAVVSPRLFLWLQDALVSGRIPSGTTRLNGPLDKFPFDGSEGRFYVEADVQDLAFRYARPFPIADVEQMTVIVDNLRVYSERNRYSTLGNSTVDGKVEIADLRRPVLTIESISQGTLGSLRDFAAASPISQMFGGQLTRLSLSGDATVDLELVMPLKDRRSYEYTARISSNDGTLAIEGLKPPITGLGGSVTLQRENVKSESLGGRFLGEPMSIELRNAGPNLPQFRVVASTSGSAGANELLRAFELPLEDQVAGWTEFHADILFPRADVATPAPLTVRIGTNLKGLSIDLPPPLQKSEETLRPLSFDIAFLDAGERIQTRGESDDDFSWQLDFAKHDDTWDFDRGVLALGADPMEMPEIRGLHIHGQTPVLRFEEWLALSRGKDAKFGVAERIRSLDLEIVDLFVLGQHLEGHRIRVDRSARDWLVQIEGAQVEGSVFVPYDLTADRELVLDMERLILPGDDTTPAEPTPLPDPRSLPAISLAAKVFALGDRFFGAVSASFVKSAEGLTADNIVSKDSSFEITGSGRWVYAAEDPMGSRSFLTASLTSRDVVATMRRLNYSPGIVSDDMGIALDVTWSGGPRMEFLETLDGEVQVRFGSGQLDEVEPGAGRMFGLMSIVALPRRLSLDFRDVFQKGFGFDSISGTFRIDDGAAYTCNLSLEGPAANIGIIGKADLVARNYAQTAVVSANVGNTLPVVGALAAGPQVAAALFLFSQIFRKPLQDIGQVYYGVSGSWDAPDIDTTNAAAFAASGSLAGCLDESE